MDYARKIGKEERKITWSRKSISHTTLKDPPLTQDKLFSEDRTLANWRKWLEYRKVQSARIKSRTGRDQADQILNSCENVRPFIEMKNLMEYGNEPIKLVSDKYRGDPNFWEVPIHLPARECAPKIFAVPTKKQANLKPELMYATTPELIKKEKNLVSVKSPEPRWKKSGYLRQRKQDLAEAIKGVIEKEPEMEDLVIEGKGVRKAKIDPKIPLITVASPEELESESDDSDEDPDCAIILKIQDREIAYRKKDFKSACVGGSLVWDLKFRSTVGKRYEQEVVLENKGNCTIVYQWREVTVDQDLFPLKSLSTPFFFNKTKGVIPPGQFSYLKVWYLPRSPASSTESWQILTEPKLCPSELVIRFWGHAEESSTAKLSIVPDMIDSYLDQNARRSLVREILAEIIDGPRVFEGTHCSCHFTDAETFGCKNQSISYSPELVIGCRRLYREATYENAPLWNLSLKFLKQTLLRIQEPEQRERMLKKFSEICERRVTRGQSQKYQEAYEALCRFFDSFEAGDQQTRLTLPLKESMATIREGEEKELPDLPQASFRSKSSTGRRKRSLSRQSRSSQGSDSRQLTESDLELRREIFSDRVRNSFGDTIDEITEIVQSNNINFKLNLTDRRYDICM